MRITTNRLGIISAVGVVVLWFMLVRTPPDKEPARVAGKTEAREASIVSVLRVSEFETVKILTVPNPLLPGEPLMDTRCLIYVNKDINQAVMNCPPGTTGRPE